MESLGQLSFGLALLVCLGWAVVSAVAPWVNAEVLVVSLPAVAGSPAQLAILILVVTVGQMAGKCIVYWVGRRGAAASSGRIFRAVQHWRARVTASAGGPFALVATSSLVSIPPFYVMAALAGALKMRLGSFLVAGTLGRLVRFSALALLSKTVLHLLP